MSIENQEKLSLQAEYESVDLGDKRRNNRLLGMVDAIADSPHSSMPDVFSTSAELEGSYRFLRNDNVEPEAILAPHKQKTAERARACDAVIVPHDTTQFNFGTKPRKNLGRVGRGKSHGFYGHVSLAVDGDSHLPLGVVSLQTHRRDGKQAKNGGKASHRKRHDDPTNEGLRWFRGVLESAETLAGCEHVIHVMDREADDYALLADMKANGHRFVVRSASDRRTVDKVKISEVLQGTPLSAETRVIEVSKRDASPMPGNRKRHPPRSKRRAELAVRATKVTISRPDSAPRRCPAELELTLVQVTEPSPPEGDPPVQWTLWTTEPCETPEQLWAVVDAYRARWVIEEYFKVVKTGCAFEARQFETEEALLRLLAIFIPIAWWLLMLRTTERIDPELPATALMSPLEIRCLRGGLRKLRVSLPPEPSVRDVLRGLARLGGHIPRNGPPGWQVLMRGMMKLILLVEGYQLAQEEM